MNRRSALLGLGLLLFLVAVVAGVAGLVRREPAFYTRAVVPKGKERKELSSKFMSEFLSMHADITGENDWNYRFTAEQINSFFAEDFVRSGIMDKLLPECIHAPRVEIDDHRLRLAFRYGGRPWTTVVSIDLGVWLVQEPNAIALELQGMRAGALPISAQSLLEGIYETARQQHIDPSPWYRHNGNPVTLLRFQADQPSPTVRLKRLELRTGEILISGGPSNSGILGLALPAK